MKRTAYIGIVLVATILFVATPGLAADCWWGVFPDSDKRYLSEGDLAELDHEHLWMARNEIFARRGYIFKTEKADRFARTLCYYLGMEKDVRRVESTFNRYERRNIELIKKYENKVKPTPPPTASPWIFPDSSDRYLTDNDLRGLQKDILWRARNEIFARHGYIFKTSRGKRYAKSLGSFYNGKFKDINHVYRKLNAYEKANIEMIKRYEGQ